MDDILIKGGMVVDGTGAPAQRADVAIRDGRIAAIEEDRTDSAERVIDAEGCLHQWSCKGKQWQHQQDGSGDQCHLVF